MATLLTGCTLVELEPAVVEPGALRIQDGRIIERAPTLEPKPGEEVVDVKGKLVMPGLVSAHHALHATLFRGRDVHANESDHRKLLERYQRGLDLDAVEVCAAAGALEGLFSGVTTVLDLHCSPREVEGSLSRVARGVGTVGLRAALGYQIGETFGPEHREAALAECLGYAKRARGRFRGVLGAAGLARAPQSVLAAIHEVVNAGGWLHAAVGHDPLEESHSHAAHKSTVLQRLVEHGLVGERTVLAHLVHCSWPELSQALTTGAWLGHVARANLALMGGAGAASKFGVRACLGTGEWPLDVLSELQVAWLKARDAGQPIDALRMLTNGQRLAGALFGGTLHQLREGALADVVILDYHAPTSVDPQSLAAHLLQGLGSHHVESVMVDGIWRLWNRRVLGVKTEEVALAAREAAQAVWARAAETPA